MNFSFNYRQYAQGLLSIIYPRFCAACGIVLYENEGPLCINCLADLPKTKFHCDVENEVARIFWGRIPILQATSFMYFTKNSRYRNILHELKYHGNKEIGFEMGKLFGLELRNTAFSKVDFIHPVPLHKSKLRQRGYNQSFLIASGMADVLNVPLLSDTIIRIKKSPTQTKKSRYDRWENVKNTFTVKYPEMLYNKHILLIDDVITTGATIEACAEALFKINGVSVSIASLAYTKLQ